MEEHFIALKMAGLYKLSKIKAAIEEFMRRKSIQFGGKDLVKADGKSAKKSNFKDTRMVYFICKRTEFSSELNSLLNNCLKPTFIRFKIVYKKWTNLKQMINSKIGKLWDVT